MKEEQMTAVATEALVRAASLAELRASGRLVVHVDRHSLCLFADGDEVYAVDNRCPHMGFPLHRGTLCDGLLFGVTRRGGGWFRGLTTLTCLMNLLPRLEQADRAAALHHGLSDVAADSAGAPPRFRLDPLPGPADPAQLARWFRGFVE